MKSLSSAERAMVQLTADHIREEFDKRTPRIHVDTPESWVHGDDAFREAVLAELRTTGSEGGPN